MNEPARSISPMMNHVVYYEPNYDTAQPNLWQLRGRYKYPSILGGLRESSRITILMHTIPPPNDVHRQKLEQDFGVEFVVFTTTVGPGPRRAQRIADALAARLEQLRPTVVSNLNGRSIVYCYATALAAARTEARYVMRIGGDDLATKAYVYENRNQAFLGTTAYFELVQQERVAAEMSDAIIAMTNREKNRLALITGNSQKISVCYRGVDMDVFFSSSPRRSPCRKFLFVGRKSEEKGYDILEAAARQLFKNRKDITFSFAGTFEANEEDNRKYIGYVAFDELPKLYSDHDAVIMCSRTEGFPQVLMEAMSCGLPCIMTRHLFEQDFEDYETALFCDNSIDDLVNKIQLLADNNALYETLAMKSLDHAKANYSQDFMREKYFSILLED